MKKLNLFFIALALLFLSTYGFADSITSYTIKSEVPLEKNLTVAGTYNADVNSGVLCKFLIIEQDGTPVYRLTDEYTFSDGTFYTEKKIYEPLFRRGQDYNVTATCGNVSATQKFSVVNREQIVDVFAFELLFVRDNGFVIFMGLFLFVVFAFIGGFFWQKIKYLFFG